VIKAIKLIFYSLIWIPIICWLIGIQLGLFIWLIFILWFLYCLLKQTSALVFLEEKMFEYFHPSKLVLGMFGLFIFAFCLWSLFYLETENIYFSSGATVFISGIIIVPILILSNDLFTKK
jgi:hypothetical protein